MTPPAGSPPSSGPISGPALFARFAYPPNALGYCGPDDAGELLELATDAQRREADLRSLARAFEGAWPYLELIASSNRIPDPLDRRVVMAYWIGNPLLARVPDVSLGRHLEDRFRRRTGPLFEPMTDPVCLGGRPHHNFHVFAVYPWLGLLRAGSDGPALTVLDRCRIRWGTVLAVDGDVAVVRNPVLTFNGSRLVVGPSTVEEVRCRLDGAGFVDRLAVGDVVALHWGWVCDRLGPAALWHLRYWTAVNLAAVNASATPGPAVAAERGTT